MANTSAPLSASMAPDNPTKDEVLFSDDRNFALHGEIMMLILLLLFTFFLFFLLLFLFTKRSRATQGSLEQVPSKDSPVIQLKGQFDGGSKLMHHFEEYRTVHQPV